MGWKKAAASICVTGALLGAATVAALPLAWMVLHSLMSLSPAHRRVLSLEHYQRLFTEHAALTWLANSLFVAGAQTVIGVITGSMLGYALCRLEFVGRRAIRVVLIATLLLPAQVTLPAAWRLMLHLHLLDSYWGLILPAAANVLGAILFYYAMSQIPDDLFEAARIDGCGELRIWWDVALPAVRPTLVTFAVLSFTANWNAYLWPQILLQDPSKYTVAIGLANMGALPSYRGQIGVMLAATTISIVPSLILFLTARRALSDSFVEGAGR